ncbi:MAG: proline dehydrogenase family protein [Acidobacteriia bacterium]|nr:proline dehydrogenase family protein [Terriglobia bacterium]
MLRELFIGLSTSRALRAFAERSPIGQKMSRRFVAGTTVEELLAAAEAVNAKGMAVSVDNLGENVTNAAEAEASAQLYHRLLDLITQRGLKANVSLKLTHMGLDVDPKLCEQLVCDLVDHAQRLDNFVRIDMEGAPYAQRTLDFVHELHRRYPGHTGAVLQAYMRRSEADAGKLIAGKIRIRLCKGAYKEPPEIAYQKKAEVDGNYLKLAKMLLQSGIYHGIATHDERLIQQIMLFAEKEKIARDSFEFQMLHGIRRDLQERIVREGWRMRVYIPFGTEWYPYLMRRLAERPANVFFIAKNIFRG